MNNGSKRFSNISVNSLSPATCANLKAPKSLVVTKDKNDKVVLSANNIPTAKTTATNSLSVYDILKYDKLVLTKDAVAAIEEVYA